MNRTHPLCCQKRVNDKGEEVGGEVLILQYGYSGMHSASCGSFAREIVMPASAMHPYSTNRSN